MRSRILQSLSGTARSYRSLLQQSTLAFAIKILGAGLSFVMFVALARALDDAGFGVLGTVMSIATFAAAVGSVGQRSNAIRFVAAYDEQDKAAERTGVMRFSYAVLLLGTLAAAAGAALTIALLGHVPTNLALISGIAALTFALGVAEFQSRLLRPLVGIILTLVPKDVAWRLLVVAVAGLVGAGALAIEPTVGQWIWFLAILLLGLSVVQFVLFERQRPDCSPRRNQSYEMRSDEWWAASKGPWATVGINAAGPAVAVVLVGSIVTVEEVGPFFAAVRIAQMLSLLMVATEVILSPQLSRALVANRTGDVQRLCRFGSVFGGSFALGGTLFFALFGDRILDLFRPGYGSEHLALVVLSIGYLINALAGPTAPLLLMSGRASVLAQVQLLSRVVALIGLPFAIQAFGTVGAAVCLAASDIVWNILASLHIRRHVGIETSILALLTRADALDTVEG